MSRAASQAYGLDDIGLGYTIATGKLYCDFSRLHAFVEELLQRPVMTHEFGEAATWDEIRGVLVDNLVAEFSPMGGPA